MMHIRKQRLTFIIILQLVALAVLLGAAGGPALAQEPIPAAQSGLTMTVEAGFDGYFKDRQWLPVFVDVSNEGPAVEGQLRVVSEVGGGNVVYESAISLPTQSHKRVPIYVYASSLTVLLVDEGGDVVAEAETGSLDRVPADGLLYGVVSSEPAVWTFLEQVSGDRGSAEAALLDVEDLPQTGAAWSGLDVLIFHEVDSGELTGRQQAALRGWLGQGGQLVVTGGPGWQASDAVLSELLPVTPVGTDSVDDLPALRNLSGEPFRDEGPYLVTTSELRSGQLVLYEDDLPLLAKRGWGRGTVYFLALDPALPPLLDWRGSQALWDEIATATPRQPLWAEGPRNGFPAASAVSDLPSLGLPSAGWLFLFLLVYVAAVGPGNYLVLKSVGRRELAWFTIPATILVFAALAYLTGFRLRGGEVIFNQMSVVSGHVEGEQVRANSLLGIYSPRRATYDVDLPQSVLVRPFHRNNSALVGSGNQRAISQGAQTTLEQLRLDVSGLETYVASSYQPLPPITGRAVLSLEGQDARLEVTVQNNSQATLENAGIFYGSSFESLGDVDAGDSVSTDWRLTASQAAATAGGSSGMAGPGPVNSQPLTAHYDELLGTTDFYNNPDVRARLQLLDSMQSYGGPSPNAAAVMPGGAITLVGWTEEAQFEVALPDENVPTEQLGTTLYFLELPLENIIASGEDVTVPPALMSTQVRGSSGVYAPDVSNLHLPPGWIEMEYEPWPMFQNMAVTSLEISLDTGSGRSAQPPDIRLWNWDEETWSAIPQAVWGSMSIGDYEPFIGEQNRVRLRLENNRADGISIQEFYPVLTGDLGG